MLPRLKRQIATTKGSKSSGVLVSPSKSSHEVLVKSTTTDPFMRAEQQAAEVQAADAPVETVVDAATPMIAPSWREDKGASGSGILEMMQGADWDDALEFLNMWGSRPEVVKKDLATLGHVQEALAWMCPRIRRPREDVSRPWTKAWKAVCEKLRELLLASTEVYDRQQAYVLIVDTCFHSQFVEIIKTMPNTLGWPLIKVLRNAAEPLQIDVTSQFLAQPSEGFFFLWYCTFWEEKRELRELMRRSHIMPSPSDVATELLRVREVDEDQVVFRPYDLDPPLESENTTLRRSMTRFRTGSRSVMGRSGFLGVSRTVQSDFFSPSAGDASSGGRLRRGYTQATAESPNAMEEGREDDDEVMSLASCPLARDTAASVLEALASHCMLRRRRRAAMKRMYMMLNVTLGNHDFCIERLIVSPRLFLAFGQEESALQFLIAMLLDLDTKQMMTHFDRLQDQLQRFIRYHTNPLFSCLKLTAAVSKLCKQSSMAHDIWHGEHARLKKAAVQIFELLPQDAFDKIFENTTQRQTFMKLAFHEAAECSEMMDAPRFQDYLRTRWDGAMPWFEDVQTQEDYIEFCRSWLDPNTLIFSPKLRILFHASAFVLFTLFLQLLPSDFFLVCRVSPSPTHILLWTTVLGYMLQVATGQGRGAELFLVLLYLVLFVHCVAPLASPCLGLDGDPLMSKDLVEMVWGVAVCVMTLRWLKFFSCFPRFGEQLRTITNMLQEMLSFLLIFFLFLLAFAMLFSRLRPDDPDYANLPTAVVTMFRCSLVDFEIGGMIEEAGSNLYVWVELVFFLMFLLIASVLLLNFLISIMNSVYESVRARGNTESAKAFLETISDGESHSFWEMNALPPPFNTVYAVMLPFHFAVAFLRAVCYSPSDRVRRSQYLKFLCEHEAPPVLMSLLVFPATLALVALATFPGFVVMLFFGPALPFLPWLLEYDEELLNGWDFARYHVLVPTIWLGGAYWTHIGEGASEVKGFARWLLMPFLSLGAGLTALLVFVFVMPFYWVWEAGVSKWLVGSKKHQQQWRTKAGGLPFGEPGDFETGDPVSKRLSIKLSMLSLENLEAPRAGRRNSSLFADEPLGDGATTLPPGALGDPTERALADESLRAHVLKLLNSGKVMIPKGDPAFAEIMGDEDSCASPAVPQSGGRSAPGSPAVELPRLRPLKQECHTHFTRQIQGAQVLDLGMLWCFERQEPARIPDILAKQLDRVFTNLHSHEERIESMLRQLTKCRSPDCNGT